MAFKYSTGFKNAVLATGSVKTTFQDMVIKIYEGSVPASADAAIPVDATLLLTFTDGGGVDGLDLAASASGGVIEKLGTQTWQGNAVASGAASFFRAEGGTDDQGESAVYKRIQGTVGSAGADLNMAPTDLVSGDTYTLDFFAIEMMGG